MAITMEPIGFIYTDTEDISRHWTISDVEGVLIVDNKYAEGLKDIQAGQRIVVIFHFHNSPLFTSAHLIQTPRQRQEKRGVFSICSPIRPNPVGMSILDVLEVRGTTLHVRGVDMLDGTPVLDIKPLVEE